MTNELGDAISPYLRSHAGNPVDWRQWGAAPFEEAAKRGVPVMVSIGYSTCHWCHVMARESFSDPAVAAHLNENFVSIKVDREEHPDVDASYLAAASAFTGDLGWPLTIFATPEARTFYAGTYFPPQPVQGRPSFTQVLGAVLDAWCDRRDEVEQNAGEIATALAAASAPTGSPADVPSADDLARIVMQLDSFEDSEFGGFGRAPKFPIAPVQQFLLDVAASSNPAADDAGALVTRTLTAMAASPLRDPVEGGFFRYSVRRDWHEPHYERMLYDNALLLRAYSRAGDESTTSGIADFLLTTLRREAGGFGSAQDSESDLGEGGYYALDAARRQSATPPVVDGKVLAGWNGLAIGALAEAGARHGRPEWIAAAEGAARRILRSQVSPEGLLLRAAVDDRTSTAVATLEDYGMFAEGLLDLAIATGDPSFAVEARRLVDACLLSVDDPRVFAAPGGGDPVLVARGLAMTADPSEGAYPSGLSAIASASFMLSQLASNPGYHEASARVVGSVAGRALDSPTAFGAALSLAVALGEPATQLVVVADSGDEGSGSLVDRARTLVRPGALVSIVTSTQAASWSQAGFDLYDARVPVDGRPTAYLCHAFVCALPVTSAADLADLISPTKK